MAVHNNHVYYVRPCGAGTSVDQRRSTLWAPHEVTHEIVLKVPQFHA